ncbi:MAG: hypothetical protein ABI787_02455 [Spartobacteria bacterium]
MSKPVPQDANSKPKKNASPGKRPARARKAVASPKKEATQEELPEKIPSVGRLERTRRLLLAALRVWEIKRRLRD